MEKLVGTAHLALEHALTLVLLSSLIEYNCIGAMDSIVVNTVVVVKRMLTKSPMCLIKRAYMILIDVL